MRVDERSFYLAVINSMPAEEIISFIYPRMFSIHDMPNNVSSLPCLRFAAVLSVQLPSHFSILLRIFDRPEFPRRRMRMC